MTHTAAPAAAPVTHTPYPHLVGYLYDCPKCCAQCHCQTAQGPCAYCIRAPHAAPTAR